jgi:hypothetical protein
MQKIQIKKINQLLNYQPFLKNNNLKKNKYKLKNILFENEILLKKNGLNLIELNNYENSLLPSLKGFKNHIVYTIQTQYENYLLFNYTFNYNLLYYFSKIFFKKNIKENKKIIKARILGKKKKKILISIFGLIIKIKLKKLHKNKKIFYGSKLKSTKIISFYKLKYLNFKIDTDLNQKSSLSRKLYVQEVNEEKKK